MCVVLLLRQNSKDFLWRITNWRSGVVDLERRSIPQKDMLRMSDVNWLNTFARRMLYVNTESLCIILRTFLYSQRRTLKVFFTSQKVYVCVCVPCIRMLKYLCKYCFAFHNYFYLIVCSTYQENTYSKQCFFE